MTARAHIPEHIQHRVLDRSRRRCALCVHFDNDWAQKQGQIAHLDRDPSNFAEDNLAFLCLPHHDDYDTKRRQTKNLTILEAKTARDRLYASIEGGSDLATAGRRNHGASPLLIMFDHRNPNRKFWSIEPVRDEAGKQIQGSYWEYRAIVKNSSASTVRNVRVLVEATGPLPTRPEQPVFDIDRKPVRDLAPEEEALAVIRVWYNPPVVEGMVCGDDVYGPIKMIAHGDDVQPKTKLFHFNPERTPMIWEFSPLEEPFS
jgi:hypothetical protein